MQTREELLSKLPAATLKPPTFLPTSMDETGDALAFAAHVSEAAQAIADSLDDGEPLDPPFRRLLTTFAQAVSAQAAHVAGMVEAGAGARGRPVAEVMSRLASAKRELDVQLQRLLAVAPRSTSVLEALRAATGSVRGAPADAMDDERALYDG